MPRHEFKSKVEVEQEVVFAAMQLMDKPTRLRTIAALIMTECEGKDGLKMEVGTSDSKWIITAKKEEL